MAMDLGALSNDVEEFLTARHLASLTTLRADGRPHVVPVGFSWDSERRLVRVITRAGSQKVHNAGRPGAFASVCQIDGGRWLTLSGPSTVTDDPDRVAEAVRRYAARYREPEPRVDRVAIEIAVTEILGRA